MRTFFFALCLLLIAAASYVFYLDRKLEPIMNSPGVQLNATRFTPINVAKKRRINLGYASFSIPESIRGDPVNLDSSGVVDIGQTLVFWPPQSSQDAETASLLQRTSALMGESAKSWFELKKLILAQQPFSIWQLPSIGKRKAAARAVLLLLKSTEFSPAKSVRILENDRLGLIISSRAEFTIVLIADLKSGTWQNFTIISSVKDVDEVVSAIASDYELHLKGADIDSVKRLLDSAGIKVKPSGQMPNQSPN
jgi:hypothetical protein